MLVYTVDNIPYISNFSFLLLSDISVLLIATGGHFFDMVIIGFWFSLYFHILLETYNQQYIPDNRQNVTEKKE